MALPERVRLSGAAGLFEEEVQVLVDGHRSEAYELPESFVDAITAATHLNVASEERGREHQRRAATVGDRENAVKALLRDAAVRQTIDEGALAALFSDRTDTDRLRDESVILGEAARSATRVLEGVILSEADDLGRALKDALNEVLAAARPYAGAIDWERIIHDPTGVKRAKALEVLVARHQAIRTAAVALHHLDPDWQGITAFAGPGSGLRPPEKHPRSSSEAAYRHVNPGSASEAIDRLRDAAAAAVTPKTRPRESAVARSSRASA